MASARALDEVDRLLEELQDRYGPLSASVVNLAQHARVRVQADQIGLDSIEREGATVMLKFRPEAKLDPALLFTLVKSRRDLTLTPPAVLRLTLAGRKAESGPPESHRAGPGMLRVPGRMGSHPAAGRVPDGLFERLGELLGQLSQSLVTG